MEAEKTRLWQLVSLLEGMWGMLVLFSFWEESSWVWIFAVCVVSVKDKGRVILSGWVGTAHRTQAQSRKLIEKCAVQLPGDLRPDHHRRLLSKSPFGVFLLSQPSWR